MPKLARFTPLIPLVAIGCAHLAPDDEYGTIDRSKLHATTSTTAKGDLEFELSAAADPPDLAFTQVTANYGVTPEFELSLDLFPWQASKHDGKTEHGFGDTFATGTWRIAEETEGRPSVALQAGVTLPTGTDGLALSSTGIEAFGGVVATKYFDHLQASAYGLLLGLEGTGGDSAAASGLFGVVAGTSFAKGFGLIAEGRAQITPERDEETFGATAALLYVPWEPLQLRTGGRTLILIGKDEFEFFVGATLYL